MPKSLDMGLLRELRGRVHRDQLDLQRDQEGLAELADWGVDLNSPQWLRLFLLIGNTPMADRVANLLHSEGWETTVVPSSHDERQVLCAERRTELSLATVSRFRRRFQQLSVRGVGIEYDGWEAGC